MFFLSLRLLIEDVTLIKKDDITVDVRFKGGVTRSLTLPKPLKSWEEWTTPAEVLAQIDRLLNDHTNAEIAHILNEQGLLSGGRKRFHGDRVEKLARRYGLKDRHARLRERGLLSLDEVARELGVCKATVKIKRALGSLGVACYKLNDTGEYMYENPMPATGDNQTILMTWAEEV